MSSFKQVFQQVADIIGNGATFAMKGNTPTITVPGKGEYTFGTQTDRCYCWANMVSQRVSQGFTVDPFDCDDEGIDEIADDLTHLIEDE